VQETLTNCAKHASAKSVEVSVRDAPPGLEVAIQDDGAGFNAAQPRQGGLGLIGMEERVRELGGSLLIDSHPGKGTLVQVRLPVRQGNAA
jgi:signal transduction histidine kinase